MTKNTIITVGTIPLIVLMSYVLLSSHIEKRVRETVLQERKEEYAKRETDTEMFLREEFMRIHEKEQNTPEEEVLIEEKPSTPVVEEVMVIDVAAQAKADAVREAALKAEKERILQEEADAKTAALLLEQLRVAQAEADALAKEAALKTTTVTKSSRTSSAS